MNDKISLQEYVKNWKKEYNSRAEKLKIFTPGSIVWDVENKTKFVKIFYHARGNFYELLWFLGSLAPNYEIKKTILTSIGEEFGGKNQSHEEYYFDFAIELGVDIKKEIIEKKYYIHTVKEFNHNFLKQIITQNYSVAWSIYSAYELLDNLDYSNLLELVQSFGVSARALRFFTIHAKVAHFETTEELLQKIWDRDRGLVTKGFDFIMENQLTMWDELGKEF